MHVDVMIVTSLQIGLLYLKALGSNRQRPSVGLISDARTQALRVIYKMKAVYHLSDGPIS
jgi:hypothetical protein